MEDAEGGLVTSAEAARAAGDVSVRFHDDRVRARIEEDADDRRRSAPTSRRAERIELIIKRLDSGEAGLRETLDLVKEGRELVDYCAGELEAVGKGLEELRLDELVARLEAGGPDPVGRPEARLRALRSGQPRRLARRVELPLHRVTSGWGSRSRRSSTGIASSGRPASRSECPRL